MPGTTHRGTDAVLVATAEAISDPSNAPEDMASNESNDVLEDEVFTVSGRSMGTVSAVAIVGGSKAPSCRLRSRRRRCRQGLDPGRCAGGGLRPGSGRPRRLRTRDPKRSHRPLGRALPDRREQLEIALSDLIGHSAINVAIASSPGKVTGVGPAAGRIVSVGIGDERVDAAAVRGFDGDVVTYDPVAGGHGGGLLRSTLAGRRCST